MRNIVINTINKHFPIYNTGRPRALSHEKMLDYITFITRTGCQWMTLPTYDKVSYKTVHRWFLKYTHAGVFDISYKIALKLYNREMNRQYGHEIHKFRVTHCNLRNYKRRNEITQFM